MSVGDAYELRGEEPESIEQLVDDVRSDAAHNLRAAMRRRGIEGKPREEGPQPPGPSLPLDDVFLRPVVRELLEDHAA